MDQTIDKVLLVCNVDAVNFSQINVVIDDEKSKGYACISQSIVLIPNTTPEQYTVSLGFSKIESYGNMGG